MTHHKLTRRQIRAIALASDTDERTVVAVLRSEPCQRTSSARERVRRALTEAGLLLPAAPAALSMSFNQQPKA